MKLTVIETEKFLEELERRAEGSDDPITYVKISNWLAYSRERYRCKVFNIKFITPIPEYSHF